MADRQKCIVILSTKSSGSSALQSLFCKFGGGQHIKHTRHSEYETLYWTKAASVLGLTQIRLPDSEVPIPPAAALRDLRTLLTQNAPAFRLPTDIHDLIFEGWRALQVAHAPVFVEKSPHHLHQRACLNLMMEAVSRMPDVDFHFVGLIRNPMDVMYSAWTRWRLSPERFQHHWRIAYQNLEHFQQLAGSRVMVIRYEDLADKRVAAESQLVRIGLRAAPGANSYIHGSSQQKWRSDNGFGFCLDDDVIDLAIRFRYSRSDMANRKRLDWPFRRSLSRVVYRATTMPLKQLRRRLRNRIKGVEQ